jgi:membrane protein DedA with SNARE-associated domain
VLELLQQFALYAPLIIFIGAVFDIFFVTGLLLYGAAMISSIFTLYATGMIGVEGIIISAYLGTVLGNTINYWSGRLFAETRLVQKRLAHPKIATAKIFLQSKGLFLYIGILRFIAISRPLYALVLGSMKISFYRFFMYESLVAFVWVVFWLFIIVQGKTLYLHLFT